MTYLLLFVALVFVLMLVVWTVAMFQPVKKRFRVTHPGRLGMIGKYKARFFPWFSDNVTFGWTTFAKHVALFSDPKYVPTIRHETGAHGFQYAEHGWWWVWTKFLGRAEREAKALEQDTSITVEEL